MRSRQTAVVVLLLALGCHGGDADPADAPDGGGDGADAGDAGGATLEPPFVPELGAHRDGAGDLHVAVRSGSATRLEVWLYGAPRMAPALVTRVLERDATDTWRVTIPAAELAAAGLGGDATIYYGLRAWGPNWPYDPAWTPGTSVGFGSDVDADGHRFNPNKLLVDPYALELSHDPAGASAQTGATHRGEDNGADAPKGIVLAPPPADLGVRPTRAFADEIVYEVHLRGLTMLDDALPVAASCRGTYAAAAAKAAELAGLGVTAVELLPVQETFNDQNDATPDAAGDNYWGYSTLAYFAPDRRYACDKTPGGPTRELREMVRAFHAVGLKVYVDVVYNHTAEGGAGGPGGSVTSLRSLRGLDNPAYYQLADDGRYFQDNTGIGANVNVTHPATQALVLDSLRYWHETLGVDGFRFDLASVLGNSCARGCFRFDGGAEGGLLRRIAAELPARAEGGGPGVDLVAEPWGIGAGTYQLGHFPAGWAEWNGQFRDTIRSDQNQLGVATVTPGWLADRLAGSPELFRDDGRAPAASVNFVVAHDGFTLRDLYACNAPDNAQAWPYGPSGGGEQNNLSWDHGGDAAAQRQAARTGLALTVLAAGVPMLVGGDEMWRTQRCNNNPYNLDSPGIWLDWQDRVRQAAFLTFATRLLHFRAAHPLLRARAWLGGADVAWYRADGTGAAAGYMDDGGQHFLAMHRRGRVAGEPSRSIYVAYNGGAQAVKLTLPAPAAGAAWYRVADTGAWMEADGNFAAPGAAYRMKGRAYDLGARALAIFVEE